MSDDTKEENCGCFIARHPQAVAIEAALRAGDDPRDVAAQYGIGKSRVYEHRRHLGIAGPVRSQDEPATSLSPPAHAEPPKVIPRPMESVPRPEGPFHGTGATSPSPPPESSARALPQVPEKTGGTAAPVVHGTDYLQAVAHCMEAIVRGVMRPTVLQSIGAKFGLSRDRVRHAYHEAARHLRLDMGGMLERQESSIAWTLRQRDDATAKRDARERSAEDWRRKEREAHEAASRITDDEARISALDKAARMGLVASKYGLEAEKWHTSALNHQKHLDDVQCLLGPKEMHLTQINAGGTADVERFAAALAKRFADRPDILAALSDAAADIEREDPGDGAIVVHGEAA
jgi:hypothetical protein